MLKLFKKIINYYKFPKYAILKSSKIDDRALFVLAKNILPCEDKYFIYATIFSDGLWMEGQMISKSSVFIRIWTFKALREAVLIFRGVYSDTDYTAVRSSNFFKGIEI